MGCGLVGGLPLLGWPFRAMPVGSGVPEYALSPDEHGNRVRVVGCMLKKGGSRGGRRNWQKRWFVLDPSGGRLRYFEDNKLNKESGQVRLAVSSEVVAFEGAGVSSWEPGKAATADFLPW